MSPVSVDFTAAQQAWAVAVLLHPHPDFGGDRFNAVIDELYRRLPLESGTTGGTPFPPCPSLRGEPCRTFMPFTN